MNILNPVILISQNKLQYEIFNSIFKKNEEGKFINLVDTINSNISFTGKSEEELDSNDYFNLTLLKETAAKFLLKFNTELEIVKLLIAINESNLDYIEYIKKNIDIL